MEQVLATPELPETLRNQRFCLNCGLREEIQAAVHWLPPGCCSIECVNSLIIRGLQNAGVGKRFWDSSFENYEVSSGTQLAFQRCCDVARQEQICVGLFLMGAIGSGKTHLLVSIIRERLKRLGSANSMVFTSALDLLVGIKKSWDSRERDFTERFKQARYLFIDDLGMEVEKDWTFQELLGIFSHRYNSELVTFISSNLSEKELLDRYGSAVISRLMQMCEFVRLDAPNYRTKLKAVAA